MSDAPQQEWTREELIALCVKATVPVGRWRNRDSASAHQQLGECWALLSAGAEFTVSRSGGCATDDKTIWLDLTWPGFQAFEYGRSDCSNWDEGTFYLPTPARLEAAGENDWY